MVWIHGSHAAAGCDDLDFVLDALLLLLLLGLHALDVLAADHVHHSPPWNETGGCACATGVPEYADSCPST
ncbi:hypothetical protein [uncultured Stenotrophomonas sp.]|uniref:hypothetical protein n=1 Tax=uncultured Stenotrophomonas sp. TaxID=165438 RepID=UPI0025DC7BDB|nr:hypothetical protein [uncultured Stenotrophomonas sp.]